MVNNNPVSHYEVFVSEKTVDVWRKTLGMQPEQASLNGLQGWISDYSFGDYDESKALAKKINKFNSLQEMPDNLKEVVLKANEKQEDFLKLVVGPKPINNDNAITRMKKFFRGLNED